MSSTSIQKVSSFEPNAAETFNREDPHRWETSIGEGLNQNSLKGETYNGCAPSKISAVTTKDKLSNKESLYTSFVRFLLREGALSRSSHLLKEKITLKVRDPVNQGVQ